jgi:trehalose 6-phosphate phosphatase
VDLLDRLREEPARAAIFLDVDGVLAPIVDRPEDSFVPDETREVVRSLLPRYGLVAVVSGRQSAEAARLVGIPDLVVAGTHGLELEHVDEQWKQRMHMIAREVRFPFEDKGVSVSFHYRGAPDEAAAEAAVRDLAQRAGEAGFATHWGRKVLEVRPPVQLHKGLGIDRLLEKANVDVALYAGDDLTDIDAFRALRTAASEGRLREVICLGVRSDETPPELEEAADLLVDGPPGVRSVLELLAAG